MAITVTMSPYVGALPQYGVQARAEFVARAEYSWTWITASTITELGQFKTQANELEANVNAKEATVVAKEALMNPHYAAIDTVATNIADVNSVASTIVPNIAEILLADTNAANAQVAADQAFASANATPWVSGTSYLVNDSVISQMTFGTYRCKVATSGTTDPSLDGTNWTKLGEVLPAQTGNTGKFLTTNGTDASWGSVVPALSGYFVMPSDYSTYTMTKDSPRIIKCSANSILKLPDARTLDTGLFCMLYSVPATTPIYGADGASITFISPTSRTYFVYLTDNTTLTGTWIFTNTIDSDSAQYTSKVGVAGNIYATSSLGAEVYPHQVDMGNNRILTFIKNQTASTGLVTLSDSSTNFFQGMTTLDFDDFRATFIAKIVGTIKVNSTQCIVVYGTSTGVTDGFYYKVIDITGDNIVVGAEQLLTTAYSGSSYNYGAGITKISDTEYIFTTSPNGTQIGLITMTLSGTTLTYGSHSIFSTVFVYTASEASNYVSMLTANTGAVIFTPTYPANEYYTYSLFFTLNAGVATYGEFIKIDTSNVNPSGCFSAVKLADNKLFISNPRNGTASFRVITYSAGVVSSNLTISPAATTTTYASNIVYDAISNTIYVGIWNNSTTNIQLLKIKLTPTFTLEKSDISVIFGSSLNAINMLFSLIKGAEGTVIISRVLPTTFYLAYYKVGV